MGKKKKPCKHREIRPSSDRSGLYVDYESLKSIVESGEGWSGGLTFRLCKSEARKILKCASMMQIPVGKAIDDAIDLFVEKYAKDNNIHPTFLT